MAWQNDERGWLTAFDVAYRPNIGDVDVSRVLEDAFVAGRVLTVAGRRPAMDVAKAVEGAKAHAVIVVDDQHAITGYLFPDWVTQQVARIKGGSISSLAEAVSILSRDSPDDSRSHFHEWLNFDRPTLRTCPGKPPEGAHVTFDSVPCSRHR